MTKLVVFDFDGTLADTRELIVRTNQESQRIMWYPVRDEASIVATIGLPLEGCLRTMYPDLPEETIPEWVRVYRQVFDSLKGTIVPALFPEVKETLAALKARGCVMSVASSRSSKSLNEFIEAMGIAPYISYVLGADNVTLAKPNPEPVLKTLGHLSMQAADTMVVGDMPVDIMMGRRAGARTCGVTYGNSSRPELEAAGADFVIDHFGDLLPIL